METKAQILKNKGNEEFGKKNYNEAITLYTQAIAEDNTQSVFYSNRGKCYYNLKQYQKAYDDALISVELDDKNIKAHLLVGQAICMLAKSNRDSSKIDLAIQRLTKALTLCAGQKKQEFERDLEDKIKRARKMKWMFEEEDKFNKNQALVKQLTNMVNTDSELSQKEKNITLLQIQKYIQLEKQQLEIPKYLQCQISHKLLIDPYTTQSGYSYEKNELFKYGQSLKTDPVSKEPINAQYIFQNINLKQAAEDFLSRNPWAYDFEPQQSIENIEL